MNQHARKMTTDWRPVAYGLCVAWQAIVVAPPAAGGESRSADGWQVLFDVETLKGWQPVFENGSLSVREGTIVVGDAVTNHLLVYFKNNRQKPHPNHGPAVSVVVGNLLPEEGGLAKTNPSPLSSPFGVDFDSRGNMVIIELAGGRIHRRNTTGKLSLVAGDGTADYTGDGGPASNATFNGMHNVAVTPNDDIYIADSWNHCIRKIDGKTGIITMIAGTGQAGDSGDGGSAKLATFNFVMCITLNATNDRLFVANLRNRRIRAVDLKQGTVHRIAGNGSKGVPEDGAVAVDSPLVDPRAVAVDSKDQVYILERGGHALRVVTPDGKIRTVAGTGQKGYRDGPALQAQLSSPKHLCIDAEDNVIIADDQNRAIRKFDAKDRTLTTILGRGIGTPPVQLNRPHGVCIEQGKLYVVDTANDRILRLD